jgi:hypothetical protein
MEDLIQISVDGLSASELVNSHWMFLMSVPSLVDKFPPSEVFDLVDKFPLHEMPEEMFEQFNHVISDYTLYPANTQDIEDNPGTYNMVFNGLQCRVHRNGMGSWLGYVTPPEGLDIDYDDIPVHGGITGGYQDMIGFDCCHYKDVYFAEIIIAWQHYTKHGSYLFPPTKHVRDYEFVINEVEKLAHTLTHYQEFGTFPEENNDNSEEIVDNSEDYPELADAVLGLALT